MIGRHSHSGQGSVTNIVYSHSIGAYNKKQKYWYFISESLILNMLPILYIYWLFSYFISLNGFMGVIWLSVPMLFLMTFYISAFLSPTCLCCLWSCFETSSIVKGTIQINLPWLLWCKIIWEKLPWSLLQFWYSSLTILVVFLWQSVWINSSIFWSAADVCV